MRRPFIAVLIATLVSACGDSTAPNFNQTGTPPDTTLGGGGTPSPTTGFVDRSVVDGGVTYRFKVFVPANYNATAKVPVIMSLHGSGEKGSDPEAPTNVGLGRLVRTQLTTFPAIVIFPQSPPGETGRAAFLRIVPAALDQVLAEYTRSDRTRVYLTGYSYGAIAGFEVAYANPTKYAAYLPISGVVCADCFNGYRNSPKQPVYRQVAARLMPLPIRQFQGDVDTQVSVVDVRSEVQEFLSVGEPIKYDELRGADHSIDATVYARADVWAWLWAQHR